MPMGNRGRRRSSRTRPSRSALVLRWLAALVLVAIAVGYVHPIRAYREARAEVAAQRSEVDRLERGNAELERRLKRTGTADFVERQARRIGLVRPGERLFIVTGIERWRKERRAEGAEKAGLR
jgi:cell division protein FtsB